MVKGFTAEDIKRMGTKHPAILAAKKEEDLREEVNSKRQKILERYKYKTEPSDIEFHDMFSPRWWKFDGEIGGKIPFILRYGYSRLVGTGQVISLGAAVSVGPSWGAIVITVPMFEFTVGFTK